MPVKDIAKLPAVDWNFASQLYLTHRLLVPERECISSIARILFIRCNLVELVRARYARDRKC